MTVKFEKRVHFYETDEMGVVHHSNYIRWFEIGRVEFLRAVGITLKDLMADGILFPLTEVNAKFLNPSDFDDVLEIKTTATELTKVKMAFDYEISRKSDGKILVTGHSQNVFTNADTGKISRLPDKYYSKLESAKKNLQE